MVSASARCFFSFLWHKLFYYFNTNNFLRQVHNSWTICFSQERFSWKTIPRTFHLSTFSTLSLLRSNEYSESCKKFCLILVVEKMMYFILAPFSKGLLFRDQTFRLFRRFWVFGIVCWICEILKYLYCVASSTYWHVFTGSVG